MPAALNRREFLAAGAAALTLPQLQAKPTPPNPKVKSVIFINMVGGPSHLDTFDPKPGATSKVRGPFRPISTSVPGMQISELFPNMAKIAHKFNLIRGMHHTAPPIHELGQQLINTGRVFGDGPEWPNLGAVVSTQLGKQNRFPAWSHFSEKDLDLGLNVKCGQNWGFVDHSDSFCLTCPVAEEFWIKLSCADRSAWSGGRFTSVNQFHTVFDQPSWDCHADLGSLSCDLNDYRETVAPSFDDAFTNLIEILEEDGLLETTLVVATGEFGRTPYLNSNGGRDHWANCWTAIVAGGGTGGGKIIGSSDKIGGEPASRPTTPQELFATMGYALGLDMNLKLQNERVFTALPIKELW